VGAYITSRLAERSACCKTSQRFCVCLACAYTERDPGALVSAEPEGSSDLAYVASVHGAPEVLQ